MREVFEDGAAGERRLGRIVACVITRLDPCADAFDDIPSHSHARFVVPSSRIDLRHDLHLQRQIDQIPDGTNLYTNDSTSDTWIH